MTFLARDTGVRTGEPITLLKISRADGTSYFTNAGQTITYDGDDYEPAEFEVGDFFQGHEPEGTILPVIFPVQSDLAQAILTTGDVLLGTTEIFVITGHRDESEAWVGFAGSVSKIKSIGRGSIELSVERFDGLASLQVPRMVNAVRCQNVLGDHLCKVVLDAYAFISTIDSIDIQDGRRMMITGLLTAEGTDGSRFVGGTLLRELEPDIWIVAGRINYRGSGDEIVLLDANPNLESDMVVKLWPGCDRLITTCRARFDNVHIGFTGTMPLGNPNRSIMEGTGFLGYALEEDQTGNGTTTDPAPRPSP